MHAWRPGSRWETLLHDRAPVGPGPCGEVRGEVQVLRERGRVPAFAIHPAFRGEGVPVVEPDVGCVRVPDRCAEGQGRVHPDACADPCGQLRVRRRWLHWPRHEQNEGGAGVDGNEFAGSDEPNQDAGWINL